MKKLCVLLGLFITLQLSAQKKDFQDNQDGQRPAPMEQGAPEMNNQKGLPPHCDKQRPCGEGFNPGQQPFDFCLQKLNDKEKEQFFAMQKDLRKAVNPMENELRLRRAELDYLIHVDDPSIDQIGKKLDEISALDKKIKLEQIKFGIKAVKAIPALMDIDTPKPMH